MPIISLGPEDVDRFLSLRGAGLDVDADAFRFARLDDVTVGAPAWQDRFKRDYVIAIERNGQWLGIGGLSRLSGTKLDHKGLIWGMYVIPTARGTGVADELIVALIGHARERVRQLQLTVMADNERARAFYERHGFIVYGVEPASVQRSDGFADEALMWRPI